MERPFPEAAELMLDIETDGLELSGNTIVIAVSDGSETYLVDARQPLTPRVFRALGFASGEQLTELALVNYLYLASIRQWLAEHVFDRHLVIHNSAFDLVWLTRKYALPMPRDVHDTLITEQLLTAGVLGGNSLKEVAEARLGIQLDKTMQTSFALDIELDPRQLQYAIDDTKILLDIKRQQVAEIAEQGLTQVYEIEHAALPIFNRMIAEGIYVDRARLAKLVETETVEMVRLEEELVALLSQHVMGMRIARYDAELKDLKKYLRRVEAEEKRLDKEWAARTRAWRDYAAEHLVKQSELRDGERAVRHLARDAPSDNDAVAWVANGYHDLTRHQATGEITGMRRYRSSGLTLWRKVEGNVRPKAPKLDDSLINLGSWQQVHAAFRDMGVDLRNAHGKPSTSREVIQAALPDCPVDVRPVLEMFLRWRKKAKRVQSFGEGLIDKLDEFQMAHGGWRQIGTATGRPSCSTPNLLNIPKDDHYRRCFRARPGHVFIVADYSQFEMRVMAELSGDPAMVKAFIEGLDTHSNTAAQMYGVSIEDVIKTQRDTAKVVNFGIMYGLQPMGLRTNMAGQENPVYLTEAEAEKTITLWKRGFPRAARRIEMWGEEAVHQRYTSTPLGRRRNFTIPSNMPTWQYGSIRRAGANHPIQGCNADVTKLAMALIDQFVAPYGGRVVLQVYDEIVTEVPRRYAEQAYAEVRAAMLAAANPVFDNVPVAVDAVISPSWSESEGHEWMKQEGISV